MRQELDLRNGGKTFEIWRKPLANPQLKVYFFNVTNPVEFLHRQKPILEEIGPYVYE